MGSLEDQIIDVIQRPGSGGEIRVEPWPRWVRAFFSGAVVADSKRVMMMLDPKHLPVFYFPQEDVRMNLLRANGRMEDAPLDVPATLFDLVVGDRRGCEVAK